MQDLHNYDNEEKNKEQEELFSKEWSPNEDDSGEEIDLSQEDYEPAISGTVSEKHALSVYQPKPKKKRGNHILLATVLSSVITSALCFFIFMMVFGRTGFHLQGKPNTQILNINGSPTDTKNETDATDLPMQGGRLSVPDIYDKVSPAVVSIKTSSQQGNGYLQESVATGSGSGVILTADGYIVTNNHVVDGASIITVKTTANQTLDAQIVGKDARTDLAVLKVECDKELPFAELGDSSTIRVGDTAIAIGNPLQEELASTLTVGNISAINRTMVIEERQMTLLQTDAAINPGNSGGALINTYGQVIGITTAKSTGYDVEGLGFAIPINEAIPIVESIIEHGYVKGRPLVGITGIDVTEQIAKANNLPIGVYVKSVIEGGAADKGGVKPGDVILKFGGNEVASIDEINQLRDEFKVGDTVELVVSRNGEKKKLKIVLQEEKPVEELTEESVEQVPRDAYQEYQFPSDFFSWFGR